VIIWGNRGGHDWSLTIGDKRFAFRLGTCEDNQELLAQGRFAENAKLKRDCNRLPLFTSRAHALAYFGGLAL
jgi:hypothetical protein